MKKLLFLFCCFLFAVTLPAQQLPVKSIAVKPADDFCSKLTEIMAHAYTNFEKIKTEEVQPHEDQKEGDDALQLISLGYKASLNFPGAKLSSVYPGLGYPDEYVAYFGVYQTIGQAAKTIDTIKTRLAGCLKDYKVEKKPDTLEPDRFPLRYVFDEKRKDKIPPHQLTLYINTDLDEEANDVFKIHLTIHGLRPVSPDSK